MRERAEQHRASRAGDVGGGTDDAHDPSSDSVRELRTERVVRNAESRNPSESQGELVSALPPDRAVRLGARILDDAMHDLGLKNTEVGFRCGLSEKSIRNARCGVQSLPLHTLLQFDDELFDRVDADLHRERERMRLQRPVVDTWSALITVAERSLAMGMSIARAQRRLLVNRNLSRDVREDLTTRWTELHKAGEDMVLSLTASRGDAGDGGAR